MTNDRELLELAAKAGGYDVVWNEHWQCFQHRNPSPDKFGNVHHQWIPMDDDGDALRIAVKLRLEIINDSYMVVARQRNPHKHGAQESLGIDDCKATRMAIVRAAAEIGRGME